MIYYPINFLIKSGHYEIIIITNEKDLNLFKKLLRDERQFNCRFIFLTQKKPNGIPEAFKICQKFIKKKSSTLILGDNLIFYKDNPFRVLKRKSIHGANIFLKKVNNPKDYGIAKLNSSLEIEEVIEKPISTSSKLAIIGLYQFDHRVTDLVYKLKKSKRGEYEIIDLINLYLKEKKLSYTKLDKDNFWLDTGTFENLLKANIYVKSIL